MGKLVHLRPGGAPIEFRLDRQRITIGRRPDNDICLAYPAVSGEHAAVVTILADSFLEDLGSTNGTLVNGVTVTKHFLRDRDRIDIGQQILVYLVDDAAKWEAAPSAPASAAEGGGPGGRADAARAKRRSDAVAPAPSPPSAAAPRTAAAEGEAGANGQADRSAALAAVPPSPGPEPALRVVSGPKAGRIVALVKDETLIGRTGVQVAALRRSAKGVRVVPVEGADPPSVNGTPIAPDGHPLAVGDILEIAGAKLEVVVPGTLPSA